MSRRRDTEVVGAAAALAPAEALAALQHWLVKHGSTGCPFQDNPDLAEVACECYAHVYRTWFGTDRPRPLAPDTLRKLVAIGAEPHRDDRPKAKAKGGAR